MSTIYELTYTKISPGERTGQIGALLGTTSTQRDKAMKLFDDMVLSQEYFRKEMWTNNEDTHERRLIKYENYKSV